MSKILVIGHSHTIALMDHETGPSHDDAHTYEFLLVRKLEMRAPAPKPGMSDQAHKRLTNELDGIDKDVVKARISEIGADAAWLCINGNEHAGLGLFKSEMLDADAKLVRLAKTIRGRLPQWLDFLLPLLPRPVFFYPSPPPVGSKTLTGHFQAARLTAYVGLQLEPPAFRSRVWQASCDIMRELCEARGIRFVPPPAEVFQGNGLLSPQFWGADPMHGNRAYGRVIRDHLRAVLEGRVEVAPARSAAWPSASSHPYANLPDTAFWKQSISLCEPGEVDPVVAPPFRISRKDQVATAGSCFAQHISKRLRSAGFRYMVAETGPDDTNSGERRGFYDFSARYGNVYTARQLAQLFDRAFGYYRPVDRVWARHGGGFCDPFRPRIEPDGFASEAEVEADMRRHLHAVRRMFQRLDVFVFTLGLTESWISRLDGAAYPVAPGVVGGEYAPDKHVFANFSVPEIVADLENFISKLRLVNPKARMILTVSPVPLVATAGDRHVLVATTYSKSALRVAAEDISRRHAHVTYFPSYEIITGPHAAGGYFEADRRGVTTAGVDHVMRVFMTHMTEGATPAKRAAATGADAAIEHLEALANAACDEEVLAR